jgi:hypothetical protein
MRLMKTGRPAASRWGAAAAILLLAASTATLRASDDKEKEKAKEKRPAPAASHPAPARDNQTKAPAVVPNRPAPAPAYNAPTNRPPATYSPNGSRAPVQQPGVNAPANTGGWRQAAPAGARNPQVGGGGNLRLPPGQTTRNTDGSAIHRADDGRVIHMDPRGRVTTVEVRGGGQVHYAPNGRPDRVVTPSGAVIMNRPGGVRQIVVERPGRVMIVTNPRGQGYIQRPLVVGGHEFYQRTYYVGGRPYVNVYRPYMYHGVSYPYYMPARYYRPAFYGWVGAPWGSPVIFNFGWGGSPWYGYYGPYFAPYPVYRSPVFWLTDYFIAATLQSAYDQRMADNAAAAQQQGAYPAQEAMRPEVKQMVADEVQRQLAQERADSQNSGGAMQDAPRDTLPGIFNDGASHALVVHNPLQVDDGAMGCALTEGDVIGFNGNLTPGVESASARVLASRGRDCATGSTVVVPLQDILEMQNQLRETIDRGLGELQSKAGRGGIPAPPAQAMGAPVASPLGSALPPADPNGAAELSQQAQAATQGEQAVLNSAPPLDNGGGNDAQQPPTVSLGMTTSQVQSLLGPPKRVVDLGPKKMFIYDDMKVIFMDDRVSDVQ